MDSSRRGQTQTPAFYQNVVVMRHGDRLDTFDSSWFSRTIRRWDPPLAEKGRIRAFSTGRKFRNDLGFPLHRVFVSPFLRCVQTAAEIVAALSAVAEDPDATPGNAVPIDPSKLKVSVEYGLCEMMSRKAIRVKVIPKDGNWGFDISQLEALLPAGTVDKNVERVYKELPKWEEPVLHTKAGYEQIVKDLADEYHTENLLLVTHAEAIGVALSAFKKGAKVYKVDYCGYVELRRPIFRKDQSFIAGEFEVVGQASVNFIPTP